MLAYDHLRNLKNMTTDLRERRLIDEVYLTSLISQKKKQAGLGLTPKKSLEFVKKLGKLAVLKSRLMPAPEPDVEVEKTE